jgi:hypothetical protein
LTTPQEARAIVAAAPAGFGSNDFYNVTSLLSIPLFAVDGPSNLTTLSISSTNVTSRTPPAGLKVFGGRKRGLYPRQSLSLNPAIFSSQQTAISQGYADGYKAARTFAMFRGSRLGFVGQFMADALAGSPNILAADAESYRTWFLKGLADGELKVLDTIKNRR